MGQSAKLPAETVFQPGDVITPEVLEEYASNNTLQLEALWGKVYFIQNKYNNMVYKKVARSVVNKGAWGTVNYLALDTNASSGDTGAYDYKGGVANTGKNYSTPIATVDHLYARFDADEVDPLDAYSTVAMLTGTLDYVKSRDTQHVTTPTPEQLNDKPSDYVAAGTQTNEYEDAEGYAYRPASTRRFGETYNARAVTFKSSQAGKDGNKYTFYYKTYDDEGNFRGSIRFDNISLQCKWDTKSGSTGYFLGDQCGVIARPYNGDPYGKSYCDADTTRRFHEEHYFETTHRLTTYNEAGVKSPIAQLRAAYAERVVLNGGAYDSLSHSWDDPQDGGGTHYYYVGGSAGVDYMYGGGTDSMGVTEYTFPFEVVVTGGRVNRICTTSVSGFDGIVDGVRKKSSSTGNRTVRIYGADSHQPDIDNVFGGGFGGPLFGDVDLLIRGCTNIQNVYGGGLQYTADVTGNIRIRIEDSTITKDVYGGGEYGDCLDDGSKTKGKVTVDIVRSTVNGTIYGSGKGNVSYTSYNTTSAQGFGSCPANWNTPETGFSVVKENGAIVQRIMHRLGRRSGVGEGASSVLWMTVTEEVYLSVAQVESATINIDNSTVKGTIYGGGLMGHVAGDTNISINNSTVSTVYGGSDGSQPFKGIDIYKPCEATIVVNGEEKHNYFGPQPAFNAETGKYSWSEATNKATNANGEKVEAVLLGTYSWAYGPETRIGDDGKVYSPEIAKAGIVNGNTRITISGDSKFTSTIHGGGNAGKVGGSTSVEINGGTFTGGNIYGGGRTASVAGTNINISGGSFGATGVVYGGGYEGSVVGAANITVKNISSEKPFLYQILGGGRNGTVGSVMINLENSTLLNHVYGGGDLAGATILGDVTINATDIVHGTPYDEGTHNVTIYGGGYQANVNGTITMNITDGFFEWIHGGANNGICKDVIINLRGTGKEGRDPTVGATNMVKQPIVAWCLRGGGNAGQCEDVVVNMWQGDLGRNNHIAGNDCTVNSATFNLYGGTTEQIFGGGDHGNVKTNSQVNLYGGTIKNNVYGGGDRPTSRVGGSGVLIDDDADNTAPLSISGNIYGGSDQGIVMAKETTTAKLVDKGSSVFDYGTGPSVTFNGSGGTKVEIRSGTLRNTVFAGGNGTPYSDALEPSGKSNFGSIRGTGENGYSSQLLISGGTINADVYGGNNAAGQLAGDTLVQITGGTVAGRVFGGNLGRKGANNQSSANVAGTATVRIAGGTVQGEVYGGNNACGNIVEGTLVQISDGVVPSNVFGANRGDKDYNSSGAIIEGTATVQITGGSVGSDSKYVFGGNNALGSVGATSVEITGVDTNKLKATTVYGGNNAGGSVTNQAAVTVTNSDVTYVIGGNYKNGTVGSTLVTLTNSSADNTYGGNETEGTVTGQAQVVVTNGSTLKKGVFGGNYQGGTVGSTQVTFTNSTCMATADANGNVNGGIYGGNNNGGTITGNAEVTINSGRYLRVFGGNKNDGTVGGDAVLNIYRGDQASDDSPYVYGGNNAGGMIRGGSVITYDAPDSGYHLTGLFGGNYSSGTINGKASITLVKGNVWHLLVGGNHEGGTVGGGVLISVPNNGRSKTIATPYGGNYNGGTIHGDVTLDIQAGLVEYFAFGGNYQKGTINGNVTVNVGAAADIIRENLENDTSNDRGLYGGNCKGGTINGNVTVNLTGCVDEIPYVVGGNLSGKTINGNVTVNMTNGDVKYLYGGNNANGTITGNTTVNLKNSVDAIACVYGGNLGGGAVNGLATVNMEGGTVDYLYGGNDAGGSIGTVGNANTGVAVNMTGGIVKNDLYGGSNLKGNIAGEINVTMTGGRVKNRLYGGGNKAEVTADVTALNLTFGGTAVVKEENKSGGWAYAGGKNADCQVKTRLTIQGECYVDYLFGGGSNGSVLGTHVEMSGGEVPTLFGGSDAADKGSVKGDTYVKISGGELDSVRGGGNWANTYGSTYVEVTGGIINERINGAGNKSIVTGNAEVVVKGGTVKNIFGGGDSDSDGPAHLYGDATVRISDDANITGSVYGAGNRQYAHSYGNTHIQISGGTIAGSVYGGGNKGLMEINREKNATANGDTSITITGGSINGSLFGGGKNAPVPGNATVTVNSGSVGGFVFGGGEMGEVGGNVALTINNGTFAKSVFGGYQGAVAENVTVNIANGSFADNVYGGGEMGKVVGDVTVTITGGNFNNIEQRPVEVYGGGKNATVNSTKLSISGTTNIYGNVFGGGEGQTATVAKGTEVLIDIPYDFQVTEQIHFTDDIQSSGQTDSRLFHNPDLESGSIGGSVYGGGNLGQVGVGVISAGGDKATIETVAQTKVKIVHGYIGGSVFGGGRGIPPGVTNYNIRMGTVFGSTDVDILGGLIIGNVYGGGEQSRVYASGKTAATVDITETATSTGFEKIGINGSVFGGGDRGESGAANASVPTVYGDVYVTIQGHPDNQPSEIYFITGGVYGDGNLCLVDGYRKITVKDFEPSPDRDRLKTFHSLQRADLAVLDNSAVVLLGAKDLVEEGDSSVYSINRIGKLELRNGSTVKLDQIVKYLGGLYSDLDVSRGFINKGHNGTNNYTGHGGTNPGNAVLTVDEINQYHDGTSTNHPAEKKNVVCVANGLYLEVINEQDIYGAVNGLFTLQLTYANPGEGGGFVYASIPESTGDFICETKRWTFKAITDSVNADNYENLVATNQIFIRVPGKGFRRPPVGGYSATEVYYERVETMVEGKPVYMDIIDNVGGLTATNGYTYYYWYIGGPSVTFDVDITGYIGAGTTAFQANSTLPQHASVELAYVLYGVDVNEAMRQAIKNGVYQLVQTSDVDGQQIALELRANGQSLGFLYYDSVNNVWGIQKELDNGQTKRMTGYAGNPNINVVSANQLISMKVGANNDQLTWVFHKSAKVTNTCSDLEVLLDIDLYETKGGRPVAVTTGTSSLSYTIGLNIVRLTATQSAFVQNGGNYNGVATNETVHITGSSKFTVEWQTRYVPAASPKENGLTMTWALSTREYTYYKCEKTGEYFTWNTDRNRAENFSDGMKVTDFAAEFTASGENYVRKTDNAVFGRVKTFTSEPIPAGTRITMVDMNGSTPEYYYYICTADADAINLSNFKLMGTNTTIASLADSAKPAFMKAYDAQTMAMITERLVFVFDVEVVSGDVFEGALTLQHLYGDAAGDADILDYAKADATSGKYDRYFPKEVDYMFNPGSTGVSTKDGAYKVAFKETAYSDIGTAVLNVHVEEDIEWINTLFRENGFAVKVTLLDSTGKAVAMPGGMYFEYRGEHYYPGPDSTYVSVPVMEFGDHEIIIHNPQFSLKTAVGGDTATFKVEYYSAPDANYYDSFNTDVSGEASYQIIESPSYSLRVVSGDAAQIYEPKDIVELRYTTDKSVNAATERVKVTVNLKNRGTGEYDQVDWQALFSTSAPGAMAEGNGVNLQWKIADNAAPGTYRLIFTYADHTEYVNIIVK